MALRLVSLPALRLLSAPNPPHLTSLFSKSVNRVLPSVVLHRRSRLSPVAATPTEEVGGVAAPVAEDGVEWGKVSAVLFDMDGVLCNSEEPSRRAAVDVFAELGVFVTPDDFVPFMGTGEANFLGGVARVKGVENFDPDAAKKRFFDIYLDKYAKPNSGIGFPGAFELITECKRYGLKVAVASSADRIKVNANLAAAGFPLSLFDAIVSADSFENLKPAPDIFLAASKSLGVEASECIVIEDALAGIQAAKSANMRCIAVTTTLDEEVLQKASPSLIRKEIGHVSIHDVLNGGCVGHSNNGQVEVGTTSSTVNTFNGFKSMNAVDKDSRDGLSHEGLLLGSRREILRYGSLVVAVSSFIFTLANWKALQFASPKGLLNYFMGTNMPILSRNGGERRSSRIQQIKKYFADLENGPASYIPEFPRKLDWLNTVPLQFQKELNGRIVLLDFWTYCCINCMHVLPDLEFLEKKYKEKPFTVIGVHSAKFDNEKDLEAIRNAVLRYNISHPVVNDSDMYLWRELGVNSWPTFILVGPNRMVLAQLAGEGHREDLDDFIAAAIEFYEEKKLLDNTPIPLALEKDTDSRLRNSPLKFPGKLAVDVQNNRLFISDSNHNRIVVTDLEGNFVAQIGSSEEGIVDGSFEVASFNRPQGLAYNPKRNSLYVADTENHALREIDFVNETVRTLAGNGTKGSDYKGGKQGTAQVLNSPWDVCYDTLRDCVYIAMAGQHQIWVHDVKDSVTTALSGDGYERNLNGTSFTTTSFAQPSGISLSPDGKELFVADSESSSVRSLNLKTGGSRLLVGGDPLFPENLFKFGDHDGTGSEVLLQHPLGVVSAMDKKIYVADSYNHKIKMLDPITRKVITVAGTGHAGFWDGPGLSAQLSEPAGIAETGDGRLLVADTNNSVIRCIDLQAKDTPVHTLELRGVQSPSLKSRSLKRLRRRLSADTQILKVDAGSSLNGILSLAFSVPEGYHFSKEAQSKFEVDVEPAVSVSIEPSSGNLNSDGTAMLRFSRALSQPAMGRISCKIYYCKEDDVCLYKSVAFDVSFQEEKPEQETADIKLAYTVKPRVASDIMLLKPKSSSD